MARPAARLVRLVETSATPGLSESRARLFARRSKLPQAPPPPVMLTAGAQCQALPWITLNRPDPLFLPLSSRSSFHFSLAGAPSHFPPLGLRASHSVIPSPYSARGSDRKPQVELQDPLDVSVKRRRISCR